MSPHDPQTIGELRRLIRRSRHDVIAISRVNRGMTHVQAMDVLEAALAGRANTEALTWRDQLLARNVRRECGELL